MLVGTWFVLAGTGLGDDALPSPAQVWDAAADLVTSGTLRDQLIPAVVAALLALSVGVVVGLLLGIWSGLARWGEYLVDLSLRLVAAVPVLGLVPLAVVAGSGQGEAVVIALAAAVPIYLATHAAIRDVDPRFVDLASTLNLTRFDVLRRVILPGALPRLLDGLRWSVAAAWFVLGLWLLFSGRIGGDSAGSQPLPDPAATVAVLLFLGALGLVSDATLRVAARKAVAWQIH